MAVLVDTSIWSHALRKNDNKNFSIMQRLAKLVRNQEILMLGSIRQEILSGIKTENQFRQIRDQLRAFKDSPITTQDYEVAAEFYNLCHSKGIQGSHTDFLICAVAYQFSALIFTADKDFLHFKRYLILILI